MAYKTLTFQPLIAPGLVPQDGPSAAPDMLTPGGHGPTSGPLQLPIFCSGH